MDATDEKVDRGDVAARDYISDLPAEILEAVLRRVDERTLLLSQRVSKQLQAAVAGSIHLQEKLFFRQSRGTGTKQGIVHFDATKNPLLSWTNILNGELCPPPASAALGFALQGMRDSPSIACTVAIKFTGTVRWKGDESWRRMFAFHSDKIAGPATLAPWRGKFAFVRQSGWEDPPTVIALSDSESVESGILATPLGQLLDGALEFAVARGFASKDSGLNGGNAED